MDVVSLVPSVTETLLDWGVVPAACTRFCEQPGIPTVGGTKNPDVAGIVGLAPDLVVIDEEENRREDYEALVAAGVEVHVLAVRSVGDVAEQLPVLAERLGVDWAPHRPGPPPTPRARVVVPIWRRPWMVLGHGTYGESVLAHVGLDLTCPAGGDRYPLAELDVLGRLGAGAVLAPSEPYPFGERHRAELQAVAPVTFVDGKDLFWWGSRTGAALGRLGALSMLG